MTRPGTGDDGFSAGVRTLLGATLWALVCGVAVTALGGLLEGSRAAWGGLIGTAVCVGVFGFGVFVVNAVARVLPRATLLVALLTYTLQVLAMALVFVGLRSSGVLESSADVRWLGGAVIAATIGWMTGHLVLAVRQRIPVYDLPETDTARTPGTTRLSAPDMGER